MAKAIENKGRLSLFEYGWAVRYGVAPMIGRARARGPLIARPRPDERNRLYLFRAFGTGLGLVRRPWPGSRCNRRSVFSLQLSALPARRTCRRRRSPTVSLLSSSEQSFRGAANCCTKADAARWQ